MCSLVKCPYHGICTPKDDGHVTCSCDYKCPPAKDAVWGDDRKTYNSECALKKSSCEKKKPVKMIHKGPCGEFLNDPCGMVIIGVTV